MPAQPSGVPASLHAIARLLRESPPMGPEAQQALAALLDELAKALESAPLPPAERVGRESRGGPLL